MAIIVPPVVSAIDPTKVPNRTQPQETFSINADYTIGKWPDFQSEINAVGSNVYNNASEAFNYATTSSSGATTATTQAGISTTQAGIATTQAGIATTQAGNAAASVVLAANYAAALTSTSSTSLSIGAGTKVFTTQADKQYVAGQYVTAYASAGNQMWGTVVSYSGTTLTLDITVITGSGTFSSWVLSLSGARGEVGPSGASVPIGGLVATTNRGASFIDGASTYLRTGVIAASSSYPLAPSETVATAATWATGTGVSAATQYPTATEVAGTALAFGASATAIQRTTDGGATWSNITVPAASAGQWRFLACGGGTCILTSSSASTNIIRSTDNGATWTSVTVPSITPTAIAWVSGNTFVIYQNSTTAYRTTDGGLNWASVTLSGIGGVSPQTGAVLAVTTAGTVYVLNSSAQLSKSADGVSFTTAASIVQGATKMSVLDTGIIVLTNNSDQSSFSIFDGTLISTGKSVPSGSTPIIASQNGVVIVGYSVGSTLQVSYDAGDTWTSVTLPSSGDWRQVGTTGNGFAITRISSTAAIYSVTSGTYTATQQALFADGAKQRPYYMRVS